MSTQVTRCPHCHTSFRVRDEHLQIADGAVRCGSCLQVFNARDYFISEPTDAEAPATAAAEPVTTGPASTATAESPRRGGITFMPDVDDDEPAPPARTRSEHRFTLVDDGDAEESETPETAVPEPGAPAPEATPEIATETPPEPDAQVSDIADAPEPEKPSARIIDFEPLSADKRAEHRKAVVSQMADLDDNEEYDIDLDFEGELLISDDGIVPLHKKPGAQSEDAWPLMTRLPT